MQAQAIKQELYSVLNKNSIILVESAKWLITLNKEQKAKFNETVVSNSKTACLFPVKQASIDQDYLILAKHYENEKRVLGK